MLIDADKALEGAEFDADVCIVGAGAAGITLALELIASKAKLVLIDAGGLTYSQDSQSLYAMEKESRWYPSPAISRLRYFGGSTNHWQGSVRTYDPIDFETRSWVPDSGWPFSYQDVERYYDRAFSYVEAGEWSRDESVFTRQLGDLPRKLTSAGFSARLGYVSAPTRFGTKYVDRLSAAPNLTILTRANLLSINEAPDRRSVTSLTIANYKRQTATVRARYYVIALGGIENARALLLSDAVTPGGIGNEYGVVGRYFMDHPVIEAITFYPTAEFSRAWGDGLLRNQSIRHALTLEASDESLRRYQLTNARMPLDRAPRSYTSPGVESVHQIAKALAGEKELHNVLHHLWNILSDADVLFEQWAQTNGYGSFGGRADELDGYVMQMMMEQRPDPNNRIVLTEKRDALGLRTGRIQWRLTQHEKDEFTRLVDLFAKGMGVQGLGIVRSLLSEDDTGRRFEELMSFGHHHMGTTRASADPKKGVVDADQRIHGRANIYIAGSSIFPTGGHVPPTTTIVATTVRLADHLRKRLA